MPFNQVVVTWKSPRQQATTYKYIFIRPPPHYAARNAGNIQLELVYLIKIATASFMSAWREKKPLNASHRLSLLLLFMPLFLQQMNFVLNVCVSMSLCVVWLCLRFALISLFIDVTSIWKRPHSEKSMKNRTTKIR